MSKYRPCKPHAGHLYFGDINGTLAARFVNNAERSPFYSVPMPPSSVPKR